MLSDYIAKRKIRSERTAETYATALRMWARSRNIKSPDDAIQEIKDKNLNPYDVLQAFVTELHSRKLAPQTILSYVTALKGFLLDCDFDISREKLHAKVVLPQQYEVSTDRAPTVDEVRRILLRGNLATKVAVTMLCSSGLRLGELGSLRVGNIQFGKDGEPSKIVLKAAQTKTRKARTTFITSESANLLREYLGERIKDPDLKVFPEGGEAIYHRIMRAVKIAGLKTKMDSESKRYAIHPHSFRKFFFSNCLSAGLDRGLTEGFMGHNFGLDSNYLRMSDDEFKTQYLKAADRLTFSGTANHETQKKIQEQDERIEQQTKEIQELRDEIKAGQRRDDKIVEIAKQVEALQQLAQTRQRALDSK